MATMTFEELIANDVKNVFLSGDYSQEAIYKSGGDVKTIVIQFFEEPLDKLGTQFYHAWCDFADMPYVKLKKDTLEIKGIVYGIMDNSPDEFQTGMNLFLQKV